MKVIRTKKSYIILQAAEIMALAMEVVTIITEPAVSAIILTFSALFFHQSYKNHDL